MAARQSSGRPDNEAIEMMEQFGSRAARLAVAGLLLGTMAMPTPALAWWRGGFFFGGPAIVVAPPVYYPPAYYPPAYYPAPAYYPPAAAQTGQACYAGAYVCPLDNPGPAGSPCTCPANRGRVDGRIG